MVCIWDVHNIDNIGCKYVNYCYPEHDGEYCEFIKSFLLDENDISCMIRFLANPESSMEKSDLTTNIHFFCQRS